MNWALSVIRESNEKMALHILPIPMQDIDAGMNEMFAETLEEISAFILKNFQE